MSYARPTHRYVPGVHYRPAWMAQEAKPEPVQRVDRARLRAAFPALSPSQIMRLALLHDSPGGVVEASAFGLDYASQQRCRKLLISHGFAFEAVRHKGYRLTAEARAMLLAKLKGVGA